MKSGRTSLRVWAPREVGIREEMWLELFSRVAHKANHTVVKRRCNVTHDAM